MRSVVEGMLMNADQKTPAVGARRRLARKSLKEPNLRRR